MLEIMLVSLDPDHTLNKEIINTHLQKLLVIFSILIGCKFKIIKLLALSKDLFLSEPKMERENKSIIANILKGLNIILKFNISLLSKTLEDD